MVSLVSHLSHLSRLSLYLYKTFVELLQMHALVNNRNAPDGSWINSVERCMNIMNLGLAHQSYARGECNTRESLVKSWSIMKALRDLGDCDEMVKEEWSELLMTLGRG
jgi:hypothetical protein